MAGPRKTKRRSPDSDPDPLRKAEGRRFGRYAVILAGCVGAVLLTWLVVFRPIPQGNLGEDSRATPPSVETVAGIPIVLPTAPPDITVEQLRGEGEQVSEDLRASFPKSPEAIHAAATFSIEVMQTTKAEELWQECLELSPKHLGAHVGLGAVALSQGKNGLAIERARRALALGSTSDVLYRQLGDALGKVGKLKEAEEVLQRSAVEFPASAELWLLLGKTQTQLGKLAEAEKSLRKSIELDPDLAQPHFSLAAVCTRQGKHEEAAKHQKRCAELRAGNPLTAAEPFQVRYQAHLRRIVSDLLSRAGRVYYENRHASKAEGLLLRAMTLDPENAEGCRMLGRLCRGQGRIADARTVYRRLTQLEPQEYANHVNLASLSAQLGDVELAESALKKALLVKPEAALAYASLAQLYLDTGRPREARLRVEEAIRRKPTAEWYMLLAAACEQLGDREGAVAAADKARRQTSTIRDADKPPFPGP